LQFECQLVAALGQRDLARARVRSTISPALQRLCGVAHDVEDGLDQLLAIAGESGRLVS
jgi:hypothetical protein